MNDSIKQLNISASANETDHLLMNAQNQSLTQLRLSQTKQANPKMLMAKTGSLPELI